MKDGVAASVPYHPVKNGWLFKTPIQYDRREYVAPLSESKHFTVSSTVKLSLHMDGFVQFSSGDGQRIISGYNHEIAQAKGLGQKAPNPIRVSTGPLFGIVLQGLHEFKERSTELVELFETEDLWRHYRFTSKEDTAYNLEVFMFPLSLLSHAVSIGNKRILRRYLPFEYIIAFPFDLRVIEIPHQPFFLGLILSRVGTDSTITSGYKLGGPGFGGRGEQKKSIGAWYPCPDLTAEFNPTSLDYRRDQETDA